ncbi:hypothetical protein JG688_00008421 [Phytophthora aleatoria]|uniref:Protein kinase domain-containing protein n=1 Tax=Phytophthora aleatoria TaxID=2496075 RepID=A0A8J5MFP8_9STRA|nr:hypothetical protein JG688_00008421 [Phytophthora aleatoria]
MKVFSPRSVRRLVFPALPLVISSVTAADPDTNPSSGSTIIYIVIAVIIILFGIVAFFVWKRKQNRNKRRDDRGYGLPSVTARSGVSRLTSHGNTAFERRMDSTGYSSNSKGNSKSKKGPGLSMMELQQSQVSSMQSSVEGVHRRQTDPAVIARTQEAAEKVMAELEEDPEFEESWIPYDSLYFTRSISKGAFGEVWLAQLENTQVAVKKILDEKKHDTKEIECFGAEIKLMALLKHPKIVGFIGVSWSDKQDLCAVTEFMAKGDLYGYLERRKGKLNWPDHKTWLAEDIAEALVYLHSLNPKVIHRDLKSKNILLDNKYCAKLSDFGISRKRSVEDTMTAGVGTIYWTAPEVLMGKKYTEKADIYSFGIVISEMDTCEVPYSDKRDNSGKKLQGMKIIQMVIRSALRPSFREDCPEQIKALANRCLDADPDARPDAPELLDILRDIQEDLQ